MGCLTRALLLLPLLAGCVDRPSAEPPGPHVSLRLTGPGGAVLEVEYQRIPPGQRVTAIELIGPDRRVYRAPLLETETTSAVDPAIAGVPTVGVGVAGGSGGRVSSGLGAGWRLGGEPPHFGGRRTVGRIALPDRAYYLATVDAWRVAIRLVEETGETASLYLPAPGA